MGASLQIAKPTHLDPLLVAIGAVTIACGVAEGLAGLSYTIIWLSGSTSPPNSDFTTGLRIFRLASHLLVSALAIVAGLGLVLARRWGHSLTSALAAVAAINATPSACIKLLTYVFTRALADPDLPSDMGGFQRTVILQGDELVRVLWLLAVPIVSIGVPLCIWALLRTHWVTGRIDQRDFATRWPDRCPQPLLFLSLFTLLAACDSLVPAVDAHELWFVWPVAGSFVRYSAVAWGAAGVLAAAGLLMPRPWAWSLSFALFAANATSTLVATLCLSPADHLAKLNFSPGTVASVASRGALGSGVWIMPVLPVVLSAFALWSRRYLGPPSKASSAAPALDDRPMPGEEA